MPRIFTIIVTYNGSKTISECLNSLQKSNLKVKTIVIDNASTDKTRLLIQEFSNIIFIPLEKNIGFGQANNIGIDYALDHDADFVFLLNQDAMVENDTIGKLVEIAVNNPDFGIISPLHLNGDYSEIDPNVIDYLHRGNRMFFNDLIFHNLQPVYKLPFINAAAWLISRKCIEAVGKFDPLFFMYGEDNDYCHRTLKRGFEIGLVPEAKIYHKRTINLPEKSGWDEIKYLSDRYAVFDIVKLIKTNKNSYKAIIFWIIDQNTKFIKLLINRAWKEIAILFFTFCKVVLKLKKIKKHKKQIQENTIITS